MLALTLGVVVTLLGIWLAANHEAGQSIVVIAAGLLTPFGFLPAQIVASACLFVVGFAFIHSLFDTPMEFAPVYTGPSLRDLKERGLIEPSALSYPPEVQAIIDRDWDHDRETWR